MNRKLEFTKALRLLDAGRDEEAVALLNTILEESRAGKMILLTWYVPVVFWASIILTPEI